jgi:hypothetical protein
MRPDDYGGLVEALQKAQTELACGTMIKPPADYPSFRQAVGEYIGYGHALTLIDKMIRDADEQQRDL